MSKKNVMAGLVATVALAVLVVGIKTAYAHCGKCLTDAKYFGDQLEESNLTLAKAATVAEKETNGKAVHATVMRLPKDQGEGIQVEVHVIADGKIHAVLVDANGKVTKKKEVKNLEGHAV